MNIVQRTETGELFTTSEAIAEGAGIQHKNVLEAVAKYRDQLEEFGGVAFKTRPFETPGGVQQKRVAHLNEQQATLILTLARNTPEVVAFKVALVKEFTRMAQQIQSANDDPSVVMARGLEAAQLVIAQSNQRIAELEPRAEFADTFLSANGDYDTRDAAQILTRDHGIQIGQNRLRDWMEHHGWLGKNRRPLQAKVDAGYLRLKPSSFKFTRTNGQEQLADPQVRVTPRGIESLARALKAQEAA